MSAWSYTEGKRPHRVRVFERQRGGVLYARVWDAKRGTYVKRSLGHRDRERAKVYAAEQYAKLLAGSREIEEGRTTLGRLMSFYLRHRTPTKTKSEQDADERRAEMWLRVLGTATDAHGITSRGWDGFIRNRLSGSIDGRGRPVAAGKLRRVRERTVEADCLWLKWVLNWGVNERVGTDRYLLRENCIRGFPVPHEKNPSRVVASRDRYEAIRAVTDDVQMEIRWEGKRAKQRSWLSEVFDLAMATGRRIGAVCALRYDDLDLDRGPFGFIRWRAETDKQGAESVLPIDEEARSGIDRQLARRPILGRAYLFPSPTNPDVPISRNLADSWLRRAEKIAGMDPQQGTLWHAYRRGWVVARKDLPSVDVAKLGGWSGTETMERVYQQADMGTMLEIVQTRHELREAK